MLQKASTTCSYVVAQPNGIVLATPAGTGVANTHCCHRHGREVLFGVGIMQGHHHYTEKKAFVLCRSRCRLSTVSGQKIISGPMERIHSVQPVACRVSHHCADILQRTPFIAHFCVSTSSLLPLWHPLALEKQAPSLL